MIMVSAKISMWVRKEKELEMAKKIWRWLLLFGFYMLIQIKYLNDEWFDSDELDIFLNGRGIANGMLLYKDAISQHMPFSYYLSALFCRLGANSVNQQRIAFYAFFAFMWVLIIWIYSREIDRRVLITYPLIHCCMIQNYDLGTTILSEHIAGCGAIILLIEFLIFVRKRNLKVKNCIMISLAVLMTFGTIFIAILSLFYICMGVCALEIQEKKKKKLCFKTWFPCMLKKYWGLLVIVAAPWILLLLYYLATHTLKEFVYGAYIINTKYYTKYQSVKYQSGFFNILRTLFLQPLEQFCGCLIIYLSSETLNYGILLKLLFLCGAVLFLYKIFEKEGMIVAVTLGMYVLASGVRGLFNYHSTQTTEMMAFMMAYLFWVFIYKDKKKFSLRNGFVKAITVVTVFFVLSGYCNNLYSKFTSLSFEESETAESKAIESITEEGEAVWLCSWDLSNVMRTERLMIGSECITPWMWEALGAEKFDELKENPPRVALYMEGLETWGYKMADYATEVTEFIENNYTLLSGTSDVYVLNSYYDEACEKIKGAA